ncbi:ATP-binding cassette, sub-B (MDR TAP), member 8 [Apophysomyces sp. BC1034]|nr:ATP-binding cassette, sub-B (MDR TAP), member 8 [Apophysomyces sp. BC1034]
MPFIAAGAIFRPNLVASANVLRAFPRLAKPCSSVQHRVFASTWQFASETVRFNVTRRVCKTASVVFQSRASPFLSLAAGCRLAWPSLPIKTVHCEAQPFSPVQKVVLKHPIVRKAPEAGAGTPQSLLREIWKLVKPDLLLLGYIIITAVAAAIVHLQTPVITGELINILASSIQTGVGSLAIQDLNGPALKLFGLLSAQGLLTFAHISLVAIFGENVAKRLRVQLFSAIVQQDMCFFDSHRSGELVSRLTADVSDFKHTFKQVVTQGLKSVTQTIGSAVHLFQISASLTLTMLATMPALYILLNIYGAYLRKLSKHGKQLDASAGGVAGEVISNMRTVRAFAAEEREMGHYEEMCARVSSANKISYDCTLQILTVLYCGGALVVRNELSSGDLMSYMLSTQTAQQSLVSLGVLFGQTIKAAASASRVFEFIHMYPNVPLKGGLVINNVKGDVSFSNVEFYYPSRPEHRILDYFSLDIPQGATVALCGPSGSGKSTIAALLERFYEPSGGNVYIDGHDLATLDPSWLRHHIGYINQEPVLFATSILENIRYGRPEATMEEVRDAARKANAESFIESFPDGYDTIVGERGTSLSGGQKQRLAIARAILKNPQILILDEATSALDTHSEKLVQDALDKLMKGRTVLVIAHRLSTIRAADMIVVMGRVPGNIIEKGTHEQLMSYGATYAKLHNQLVNAENELGQDILN